MKDIARKYLRSLGVDAPMDSGRNNHKVVKMVMDAMGEGGVSLQGGGGKMK